MNKLKKAIEHFKEIQDIYKNDGACDTEPDWWWQHRIRKIIQGDPVKTDNTAYWDVFSKQAEDALEDAFKQIENVLTEYTDVINYLKDICWRVDI